MMGSDLNKTWSEPWYELLKLNRALADWHFGAKLSTLYLTKLVWLSVSCISSFPLN